MMLQNLFYGKTVLITGYTDFEGAWFTEYLKQLGGKVAGIALDPPTDPPHFAVAHMADIESGSAILAGDYALPGF